MAIGNINTNYNGLKRDYGVVLTDYGRTLQCL